MVRWMDWYVFWVCRVVEFYALVSLPREIRVIGFRLIGFE